MRELVRRVGHGLGLEKNSRDARLMRHHMRNVQARGV